MHKATTKHHKHTRNGSAYDLYGDLIAIREAFADASHDVKGRAAEVLAGTYENLKEKSATVKEGVSDYVAEKPFKSMGVMLIAGIALGYLIRK
jgi:ElaB/YqjD/DUF883 family membrane-anchored ribosome-binding protein